MCFGIMTSFSMLVKWCCQNLESDPQGRGVEKLLALNWVFSSVRIALKPTKKLLPKPQKLDFCWIEIIQSNLHPEFRVQQIFCSSQVQNFLFTFLHLLITLKEKIKSFHNIFVRLSGKHDFLLHIIFHYW